MSKAWSSSRLKTYGVVTILTVLIWVFAENESLRSSAVTIEIDFEQTVASLAVRPSPDDQGWSGRITLEVGGTASGISQFRDTLPGRLVLRAGRDFPADSGLRVLDLKELLGSNESIGRNGITIEQCTPSTVAVEVVQLVERTVRVEPRLPRLAGRSSASATPSSVLMRVPAASSDLLGPDFAAHVTVSEDQLSGVALGEEAVFPGMPVVPDVDPASAGAWVVQFVPDVVDVRVTRRAVTDTVTLTSVPVYLQMTPLELNRWDVVIPPPDDVLQEVTFTGPAEAIARIRSRESPLVATVSLNYDELARGIPSKVARIVGLPEGVTYRVADDSVNLQIRPRTVGDD